MPRVTSATCGRATRVTRVTRVTRAPCVTCASMSPQEAECLATLAKLLKRDADAAKLTSRAAAQRALISANLWDETSAIFTNKFWNGTFYRRITPTSFYAMMATAATDKQAETMVQEWLLSPEHFCVAPDGDFKGNSDDCYWGLPSIQKGDPAFPPLGYWRGYVWGAPTPCAPRRLCPHRPKLNASSAPTAAPSQRVGARGLRHSADVPRECPPSVRPDGTAHLLEPAVLRPRACRAVGPQGPLQANDRADAEPVAHAQVMADG